MASELKCFNSLFLTIIQIEAPINTVKYDYRSNDGMDSDIQELKRWKKTINISYNRPVLTLYRNQHSREVRLQFNTVDKYVLLMD